MAKYFVRVEVHVPTHVEQAWRNELGLPEKAPLLEPVRNEVWEVLTAGGEDTGRWTKLRVT
ncbi:hypothetical protein [Nocardiopsis dassonvillei]|uniref:hypothetical protein n=1 Tax=Nocardiopsis dassonvillei TaxID=2014 RepID=UPI00157D20C8|nr:hypothetical protein [Nocardiopsis dassonvillei]